MTDATPKLTWSTDKPTQEGWWWMRQPKTSASVVRAQHLRAFGGRLCVFGWGAVEDFTNMTEWAGPIPLPEEPV